MLKTLAVIAVLMILLTGCGATNSSCPPLIEYTEAQQKGLADELQALPQDSVIPDFIIGYSIQRDNLRLCNQ